MTIPEQRPAAEGQLLWTPSEEFMERSHLVRFTRWLNRERALTFSDYEALWRWSVGDLKGFWSAIWDYFEVISETPYTRVITEGEGIGARRWFEGSRTNYAEHLLRYETQAAPGEVALCHTTEIRPLATLSWQELGDRVRRLAEELRRRGVGPGDRVVSYMPNVPETAIAMLATVAVGGVWSSSAPEFGAKTVLERFGQIAPKLAFMADGYSFGGKIFDRRKEGRDLVQALPTLETVVWLNYAGLGEMDLPRVETVTFEALLHGPRISPAEFHYERVASDHPLWILFSSGTTGLPKAIVHSHVGMIVEHLKFHHFNLNLGPRTRYFFHTTPGWVMWNAVLASLITGSSALLYDGSPVHGGIDRLWRITADSKTTVFGAGPTLIRNMMKAELRPSQLADPSTLEMIFLTGAPCPPELFAWFYDNVKPDLWVTSVSGGTEIGGGLVAGVPTRPVYAAEIQGRCLGIDVHAWNEMGEEVVNEVGELVLTSPCPSMPLCFWNDADGRRYHESYFDVFPGVWRHGDRIKINSQGGCYIYGRSDSTLNRFGVRIGSAEIYRVVEQVEGIKDSLVICCETPGGGYYMPLFVSLETGVKLDETLSRTLARRLRDEASPRHVPDEVYAVPAIPYTLTGKKMEVPIRKIVMGVPPEKAASPDAMANPAALAWFTDFANRPEVAERRR
jgi:acetoacetyl-CoA synthetase